MTSARICLPPEEPPEGLGVFVLGRTDQTDIVFTANEENGQALTRYKAGLRGGKWAEILNNDRCPGWLAIAYAANPSERLYFVSKGADSEGAASLAALAKAEKHAGQKGGDWTAWVLFVFTNNYRAPGIDLSQGVFDAAKRAARKLATSDCHEARTPAAGIRG